MYMCAEHILTGQFYVKVKELRKTYYKETTVSLAKTS